MTVPCTSWSVPHADRGRLAFTLINRRQVRPNGFSTDPGGAVTLDDRTHRAVLKAYQERKLEEVQHPVLG